MRGYDGKAIPSEGLSTLHLRHEREVSSRGRCVWEGPVNGDRERRGSHMLAKRSSDKISNVGVE